MFTCNIKVVKRCAFCRYWYDPTNSAIQPKAPKINLWTIVDEKRKSKCMKRTIEMRATASCKEYECKLMIM